jgi:hypothetical protein
MVVDFWICLVIFGAIKTFSRWGDRSRDADHDRERRRKGL